MLIEHVDAIVDMRRHQTLTRGDIPGKGPEVIANLRETGTAGGYDLGARYNWAVDLDVKTVKPGQAVDVLLVAGDGARSEERRVGQKCVRPCSSRGSPYH